MGEVVAEPIGTSPGNLSGDEVMSSPPTELGDTTMHDHYLQRRLAECQTETERLNVRAIHRRELQNQPHYVAEYRIYLGWLKERYSPVCPNGSIEAFEKWDAIWTFIELSALKLASATRVERTRRRICSY